MKGKLIAIEGIDGSGKSTQISLLGKTLEEKGFKVATTFEPTKEGAGTLLRQCLTKQLNVDDRTVAALFLADRLEHIFKKGGLLELVNDGYIVICDRYYFSSYAYNCDGKDMDWVIGLNKICAENMRPSMTVFLDISPENAIKRVNNRGASEKYETLETLKRVRENYYRAFEKLQTEEKVVVVNAEGDPLSISEEIIRIVLSAIG